VEDGNVSDAAESHVVAEVRRHDRERFLTTLFAPPDRRADLWALYVFNAEIGRIRDSVSEATLGRIKVQWWRDVIAAIAEGRGAPAGHPTAQALAAAITARGLTRRWFDDYLLARDSEFEGDGFADLTAMESYAGGTAGRIAWLALETLGVTDTVSRDVANHTAVGYALAGLLRSIPFHAARNRLLLPRDLLTSAEVSLEGLHGGRDRAALCKVTRQVAVAARRHLSLAKSMSRMTDRRAMPVLLWWTIADGALRVLAQANDDVFDLSVMAYRPSILSLLWRSWRGHL